jgi:hypothetical protein
MALAYLDARDVMDRLDAVCDPGGWQSEHYAAGGGRLACKIGIKVDDEWIWKSDGAGESQFEAEKGAFSGALKRAAVCWGIGRYLYDMPAPWVPCEERNGKFSKWTADPWAYVDKPRIPMLGKHKKQELEKRLRALVADLQAPLDSGVLAGIKESYKDEISQCENEHSRWWHGDEDTPGLKWHLDQADSRVKQVQALQGAAQ